MKFETANCSQFNGTDVTYQTHIAKTSFLGLWGVLMTELDYPLDVTETCPVDITETID